MNNSFSVAARSCPAVARRSASSHAFFQVAGMIIIATTLTACSTRVATTERMSEVKTADTIPPGASGPAPGSSIPGERFDASTEQAIIDAEMKAWRLAIAHQKQGDLDESSWKKLRQADEAESMRQLEELSSRYPRTSFIKTMMGQVKQHFGKHKEAAAYYEEALAQNKHDHLMTFKLAEQRRIGGDNGKSIDLYRQALELQPDFTPAKIGLITALLEEDNKSTEARQLLADVLSKEPNNEAALKLQSRIKE